MLIEYTRQFLRVSGRRAWVSMLLFFFLGLTQGIGLLMIAPLLHTLGLSGPGETGAAGGVTRVIAGVFTALGIPLKLAPVLTVYVLIISLFAVLKRYQAVLDMVLQQGFINYLRARLYGALTYAKWLFIVGRKSSDITHTLTADIQRVGTGTQSFLRFFNQVVLVLFHIGAAFLLSVPLTAATLGFGALLMLLLRPLNRQAQASGESFRQWRRAMYGAVMEHLAGVKTAKSLGLEGAHMEKMEQVNQRTRDQLVRIAAIRANTRMYYEIAAVIFLAVYFTAALNIPALKMPLSRLLVLVFIFSRLLPRFSSLTQNIQDIKHMLPAFKGVSELYRTAATAREFSPGVEGPPFEIREGVSFEAVRFRYSAESKEDALKGVSFHIPVHQITALSGPSGAGKSTAADLLLGLLRPDEGSITADGREIEEEDLSAWRHSIGYVPQEVFLFRDTLRANLLWACPTASEEQLRQALDLAAASEFVENLAHGLDTVVGDRGITLSGGERQRIALARALLRKPQLLVLDEATSALDHENEQRIHEAIRSLEGKLTVVIIAHRFSTLSLAHHVIHLDRGSLVNA
jgi:ATP-binding cassette subfamily C protein